MIALLMGGFLAWLLVQWVSYLQGGSSLLYIVGTAAAGAIAAMVSFAHR